MNDNQLPMNRPAAAVIGNYFLPTTTREVAVCADSGRLLGSPRVECLGLSW
jgi:hypothetical protein